MPSATPVSLYLHVPFCTVKCAYCDFNSYAGMEDAIPAWESALLSELRLWAPAVSGRPVPTVFIGGGTPSLLDGEAIRRVLDAIREHYALESGAEVTLEANPESVRLEHLQAYRGAGVNRLSMGVQSLDAEELQFLDRLHDADRARWAFDQARAAGFDNVNCDLIFGLPGQTLDGWRESLEGVAGFGFAGGGPDHLSCYGLTVEEGTPLAQRVAAGSVPEADLDVVAEIAEWTESRLGELGYAQYEISNWARDGKQCRHNLVYWRQGEYVGLGPGAHGFVDGVRYAVERSPARYAAAFKKDEGGGSLPSPAVVSREEITPRTAAIDAAVLGLRLNTGIDEGEMRQRYGEAWATLQPGLDWGLEQALLKRTDGYLRLTARGRRLANEVFVRVMEPALV